MKTKNVTAGEISTSFKTYYVGKSLERLMLAATEMLMPNVDFGEPAKEIKIIPAKNESLRLLWEFYANNEKVCTLCYENTNKFSYTNNFCWIEWHTPYDASFRKMYERQFGIIPDRVEADENDDLFFEVA